MIVLPSLLLAGAVLVVVASCSSPNTTSASAASVPPGSPSSPSASTESAPSADPPLSTVSAPSQAPASKGPSQVPASKPKRVDVVTTFAGWNATSGAVEVGGYATVVEPVGTCTLRLTHGNQVVTRKQTASADATTVACGGFSVPGSELTTGQWQAVLAYASSRSTGEAATVMVKVP